MGRPLRMFEPGVVYECTSRTIQGRYLLRPSELVNALIVGIIGYALAKCPGIEIYGVHFLSNHATWLLSSSDPSQVSQFMKAVNEHISKEMGDERVHDWSGSLWGRRYKPIAVIGEAMMIERMKYLLSQGCKEGLVATPFEWPGVTCVHALLRGEPLEGTWYDRTAFARALARKRQSEPVDLEDFGTPHVIEFAKLPCWAHMSDDQYREAIQSLVDEITEETAAEYQGKVLGAKAILEMNPHDMPAEFVPTPAPVCHASSRADREAYRERYAEFVAAYRHAADLLRRGLHAVFPLYSYPPAAPMTMPAPSG
jgi:hypothetical protein